MNSILLNISFELYVKHSLLCFLMCSDSMLYSVKTSVDRRYFNTSFQNFPVFGHGIIVVFKRSIVQHFAAIFEFIGLSKKEQVLLHTNHFSAVELFGKKRKFSFSLLPMTSEVRT